MTERHNDRSIIAIWFVAFIALCALGLSGRCGADAQVDGSAEPMIVSWTGGDLPSTSGDGETGEDGGHGTDTVQVHPTEDWHRDHRATVIASHSDQFRHLMYESGPQGCVFTAEYRGPDDALLHSAGGRECPLGGLNGDGSPRGSRQCGYIAPGFAVFLLAGASCAAFGIAPCTGPFCY